MTMLLSITDIRQNGGTQPREAFNFSAIDSYAEDMAAGAVFPPIVVFFDGSEYWLADGFHRLLAAQKNGAVSIEAEVHQGTQADAQWHSYSANRTNGLLRTSKDKARAVRAALQHPKAATMSNVEIATHCGVSEFMVRQYRDTIIDKNEDTPRTVTRNGTTYQQNTANIGKSKKPSTPKPAQDDDALPFDEPPAPTSVFTPIQDVPAVTPETLAGEVDRLVNAYGYDDLCRLVEMLAARVGLEVRE